MKRTFGVVLTVGLIALATAPSWAHKGKLPQDALTLVRQASALLAQSAGMVGEARERLQAALKSKQTQGVHMEQVAEALRALDRKDIASARRLLMESIMPAGMPMPPEGLRRPSPPEAAPAPTPVAIAQAPPASSQQRSVDVAMTAAEPLRTGFGNSVAERLLLAAGLALIGLGLTTLWRDRQAARP